jgi:putative transposase
MVTVIGGPHAGERQCVLRTDTPSARHNIWYGRRSIVRGCWGALAKRMEESFREIGEACEITIEEMEVSVDHVHIFCSFPPRNAISDVLGRLESLSAPAVFKEFAWVKRRLWG